MSSSTYQISGLSSGFDWRTMVDQLIAVEHKRVDLVSEKKTEYENKLAEWQSFNTKLLALKTTAGNIKDTDDFNVFKAAMATDSSSVEASDLLSVTTSTTASIGSYSIKVNNSAAAQKLSSGTFANTSEALGSGYSGDILINGTVINIASTDTLINLKDKINNANSGSNPTGVTASIISYGTGDNRLILTSDSTGSDGISLQNGGSSDILYQLGFTDSGRTAKNQLAGGDLTDKFSSTNISIKSLLNLSTAQTSSTGDIEINGFSVGAIDLSTDTLSTLQTKFAVAGLTASITSETENNITYYRLMVEGAGNTYTDKNNILETLGLIKGGVSDVSSVTADTENTSGGSAVTTYTLLKDIDGYTGYSAGDYIHLEGTDTNNNPVADDTLVLSDTTTVGDLLSRIESLFGSVIASITGEGKLMVVDNTTGTSSLSVTIGTKNSGGTDDNTLKFDTDGILDSTTRKREIVAGADASITVDGVTVTRSENTIDDIITGVTLNLLKADTDTTISLNIGRDTDTILSNINSFVSSYNSVLSYIQSQNAYDETTQETGGILFGDGTLSSVKSDLTSLLVQSIWGVSSDYSTLGLVGISVDNDGQLSLDSTRLSGYLKSNFNDVLKLFTANGTTSVGTIEYITHTNDTKSGEYTVNIDTAATQSNSASSDNTSLSGNETLTIVEGDSIAVVNLTSSMTMSQMVNAINSELETAHMNITASVDSGNHMVLAYDKYGSGYSFTISQENDLLWTGGDQIVDNGVDVSGTINGEAATGAGQLLTGNSDEANIDGLVIKYTGTSTGEIGTIKLTLGIAELFDRTLFSISDQYEGYVAFKQDSLQNQVEQKTKQIEEMEDRLDKKSEQMINRFVAMELILSKLQNQSDWLAGQINSLYNL